MSPNIKVYYSDPVKSQSVFHAVTIASGPLEEKPAHSIIRYVHTVDKCGQDQISFPEVNQERIFHERVNRPGHMEPTFSNPIWATCPWVSSQVGSLGM